jgi:phage tail-like protein
MSTDGGAGPAAGQSDGQGDGPVDGPAGGNAAGDGASEPATDGSDGPTSLPAVRDPAKTVVMAPGPMAAQARRRPDWLVSQLPVGMLDDNFFYRFVSIFQEQAGTYLDGIDNLPNTIDPAVAPPAMVRFLAGWLALPAINPALDEIYQRRLVLEASKLQWWRGTKQGLSGLLELFACGHVEITDSGGVFRQGQATANAPQVTVRVDSAGWLSEPEFVELVRDEVPANVSLELFVGDRRLFPAVTAGLGPALPASGEQSERPALNGDGEARPSGDEMKSVL